jgi:hypothetical protein
MSPNELLLPMALLLMLVPVVAQANARLTAGEGRPHRAEPETIEVQRA